MIIDFHTHAFPDALAARTIPKLAAMTEVPPHTDGTVRGLCKAMETAGVDYSVVLPVVTKPSQFDSVNAFSAEMNRLPQLIAFGGIHPDDEDIPAHVAKIAALGLPGIKIHPDYQGVFIDDERYVRIAREALRHDLYIVTHAGVDDGFPETVHCPPERAARFLDLVYEGKEPDEARIIFAHGGGNRCFAEVKKHLAGRKVYFDLSYIFAYADAEEITDLIRAHGTERVLFASDCPWGDPADGITFVRSLSLTEEEKESILWGNAKRMLDRYTLL